MKEGRKCRESPAPRDGQGQGQGQARSDDPWQVRDDADGHLELEMEGMNVETEAPECQETR